MDTLRALFVHADWARDRLLAAAASLDDHALDRAFEIGPGTLRRTLRHLRSAERYWLSTWQGRPRDADPAGDGVLSVAALGDHFRETAAEREAFLDAEGMEGQRHVVEFEDESGHSYRVPLGDLMLHVCNHAGHHRAQVANMLRRVGADVPKIDYLFMALEGSAPGVDYDRDTILEWFRYGDWSRRRLAAAAGEVGDDGLDHAFEMGLGTLRATLLHVYDTERWCRYRRPGKQYSRRQQVPALHPRPLF